MPFPITLDAMFAAGYDYARWEKCATCGEPVEIYTTPGKREIAMEPMCSREASTVWHHEVCKPKEKPSGIEGIKLYGVTDPNYQLLAVGWSDGVLVCQWAKGKGFHTGVPEDLYDKLRRVPFAYRQYNSTIKGKFLYTKLS